MRSQTKVGCTPLIFLIIFSSIHTTSAWEGEGGGDIVVKEELVSALITSYTFASGDFRAGDKIPATITIKNIGSLRWTFYVNYSVQDPNGKWWDVPYESISLEPGQTGTITIYWIVDASAPLGSYNARVSVWKSKTDDKLVERLDFREQFNVFKIIPPLYKLLGYVKYLNEGDKEVPLEGVEVKLSWAGGSIPPIYTNKEGYYNFSGLDPEKTYMIEVSLTDGKYIQVLDGENNNKLISKKIEGLKLTGIKLPFNITFSEEHEDEGAVIFTYTLQAVKFYTESLKIVLDKDLPVEIVIFGDSRTASYYSSFGFIGLKPTSTYITIVRIDSSKNDPDAPVNREWHEFSHHVMYDVFDSFPPLHPLRDGSHGGYRNHCTSDSWTEGFAEFMALVIKDKMIGKNVDEYLPQITLEYFVSTTINGRKIYTEWTDNIDEEFAVAGILWDLYDGKNTPDGSIDFDDDNVTIPIQEIMRVINRKYTFTVYYALLTGEWIGNLGITESRHINYVRDLYDAFIDYARSHDVNGDGIVDNKDLEDIDSIFTAHGMPRGLTDPSRDTRR